MTKRMFLPALATVLILFPVPGFSQEQAFERGDFWICPAAETSLYSISSVSYGGGIALGYGRGASIGFKAAYFYDHEGQVDTMELGILLRFYFFGISSCSGPFIQFSGGPAFFFAREDDVQLPSELGMISAGISAGWRFLLGKTLFVEPSVRGGYPYIFGAGLSTGVRF